MEGKMIREGKEESIIERLEEYILPVYPEWRERRVPASEERIEEFTIFKIYGRRRRRIFIESVAIRNKTITNYEVV